MTDLLLGDLVERLRREVDALGSKTAVLADVLARDGVAQRSADFVRAVQVLDDLQQSTTDIERVLKAVQDGAAFVELDPKSIEAAVGQRSLLERLLGRDAPRSGSDGAGDFERFT